VNFTDASLGTNSLTGYYWDFGNSNISFSQNPPVQTYLYNGQYTVSLNVNDSIISGCNSSVTKTITIINAPCFVTSTFSMSKDSAITTSIVWNAYPNYPANVSSVIWNWGDNSSSTGLYPTHTYSAAGFYNICLTVSVSCGSSTTTCLNTNIFKTNNNSLQMVTVNVLNISTGINKYTESIDQIHVFPNPVKDILTIENNNLDLSITIIDLTGKIIYSGVQKTIGSKIDMRSFNSGIYFVKLSGENYYKTVKIIKE
jgi:PKD repeat protein